MILVSTFIQIPYSELEVTYVRSSGPGGQNVNKVNSKAMLRWNAVNSPSLRGEVRERVLSKLANKLTREGDIIIASDRYRDQGRNREDCYEKLREMVAAAAVRPKLRKETAPTRGSKRRAKKAKSLHSEKKKMRRSGGFDD